MAEELANGQLPSTKRLDIYEVYYNRNTALFKTTYLSPEAFEDKRSLISSLVESGQDQY
jgi:hypothetical protein